MLLAVNYMHKKQVVHRDLKPENFMFKELDSEELKLIDFGLSTGCKKNQLITTFAGSPYYMSPEVCEKRYSTKCDVWSIGVIFYELLTGSLPFKSESKYEAIERKLTLEEFKEFQVSLQKSIQRGVYDIEPLRAR